VCAPYYVEHVISVAGNIEYIDGTLLHIRTIPAIGGSPEYLPMWA
jgi:hypothetical protein